MSQHFSDAELQRWRDQGLGADRERVIGHVATCSKCSSVYARAVASRMHAEETKAEDLSDFVAAGYRVPYASRNVIPINVRKWGLPIAAAAVLALAFVVPRNVTRQTPSGDITFRGASLHTLDPHGDVTMPRQFTWSTALAAPKFKLEVREGTTVIFTVESTAREWTVTPALALLLKPAHEYAWSVTAMDAAGNTIVSSESRTFTIQP